MGGKPHDGIVSQKLARLGISVAPEHFYTSALATATFLAAQKPGGSAFVIGEPGLINALYDAGYTMNNVNPDYVVVGEGRTYSLDTLTKAVNLVMAGAKLIGANSDVSGPIENCIAPACRALVAPIEMATGKQAYFCGKPNPLMMRTGLRLLRCLLFACVFLSAFLLALLSAFWLATCALPPLVFLPLSSSCCLARLSCGR